MNAICCAVLVFVILLRASVELSERACKNASDNHTDSLAIHTIIVFSSFFSLAFYLRISSWFYLSVFIQFIQHFLCFVLFCCFFLFLHRRCIASAVIVKLKYTQWEKMSELKTEIFQKSVVNYSKNGSNSCLNSAESFRNVNAIALSKFTTIYLNFHECSHFQASEWYFLVKYFPKNVSFVCSSWKWISSKMEKKHTTTGETKTKKFWTKSNTCSVSHQPYN